MLIEDGIRKDDSEDHTDLEAQKAQSADFIAKKVEKLTKTIDGVVSTLSDFQRRRDLVVEAQQAACDSILKDKDRISAQIYDRNVVIEQAAERRDFYKQKIKEEESLILQNQAGLLHDNDELSSLNNRAIVADQSLVRASDPYDRKIEALKSEIAKLERRRSKWAERTAP